MKFCGKEGYIDWQMEDDLATVCDRKENTAARNAYNERTLQIDCSCTITHIRTHGDLAVELQVDFLDKVA